MNLSFRTSEANRSCSSSFPPAQLEHSSPEAWLKPVVGGEVSGGALPLLLPSTLLFSIPELCTVSAFSPKWDTELFTTSSVTDPRSAGHTAPSAWLFASFTGDGENQEREERGDCKNPLFSWRRYNFEAHQQVKSANKDTRSFTMSLHYVIGENVCLPGNEATC